MSKKALIVFIIAILIVLSLSMRFMYAQTEQMVSCEEIMKKLDLILENQAKMKEHLEIIEGRTSL